MLNKLLSEMNLIKNLIYFNLPKRFKKFNDNERKSLKLKPITFPADKLLFNYLST